MSFIMTITLIWDTVYLFLLGLGGWALFSLLRIPTAPFLGSLTVLFVLRAFGIEIPPIPYWLFPLMQVLIGIRVGSMVTREKLRGFKSIMVSAIIIILWALSVIFIMGTFLSRLTSLDLHTAFLAFSMAGVVEITAIALDVKANIGFIIIMQMLRLLVTFVLFPFILKKWIGEQGVLKYDSGKLAEYETSFTESGNYSSGRNCYLDDFKQKAYLYIHSLLKNYRLIGRGTLISLIAFGGGSIFYILGVPAGMMVGAMLIVALISFIGVKTFSIPQSIFNLILVGMGISVADNILPEKLTELSDPYLLILVTVSIALIFTSSFLVALLVYRFSSRDLPTCFLAAAPAGFITMTILAIKYDKDPFFVSMLQLCRLLSIKLIIPFVFMYFLQ